MIPNTTQIPNNLFNGEMQRMKDTELRIVLIVARKTLGWIEDPETGMRKKEDWISRAQLIKLTGKTPRAISNAINNCINQGWIEARDKDGNLLDTPQKRTGRKIFYRLGKIFLSRIETREKSIQVEANLYTFFPGKNFPLQNKPFYKNKIPCPTSDEVAASSKAGGVFSERPGKGTDTVEGTSTRSEEKKPDPRVKEVIKTFIKYCENIRGFTPTIDWGADGAMVKKRLKELSFDDMTDLIDWYLGSSLADKWGITLRTILSASAINRWKAQRPNFND